MAWSKLPELPPEPLPPSLVRWVGLTAISVFCILVIWQEATLETGTLIIGIYSLGLLPIGLVLLVTAIVKIIRKRTALGTSTGLAIVAGTFALLVYEIPSTLLDKYRLYRYEKPLTETLLRIQKTHPNLDIELKLEKMELNRYIPSDIPSSIGHARFFLYKPTGPTIQNLKRGVVTYGLRVDTIECRIEVGSDTPSCALIVRWSK